MIEKLEFKDLYKIKEKFPQLFEKYAQNNIFREFFVLIDQEIVAVLVLDTIYERMELINIEVEKTKRNKGYGKKLLSFMIQKSLDDKIENITLEVKETNKVAIHLYEKYGFKKVATRNKYYQGIDGILMERKMI